MRELGLGLLFEIRLWSVGFLLGVTLVMLMAERQTQTGNSKLCGIPQSVFLSVAALFVWLGFTGMWSSETLLASFKLYELTVSLTILSCLYFWSKSRHNGRFSDVFWFTIVTLSTVLMVASLPQIFAHSNAGESERIAVFGGGSNVFGRYVDICIMACVLGRQSIAFKVPLVAVMIVPLIFSGSRGAVLGLIASCVACFPLVLNKRRHLVQAIPWLGLGASVLIIATLFIPRSVIEMTIQRFETRFIEDTYRNHYMSAREQLFAKAAEMVAEKPIFGHGLAGWGNTEGQPYPHNLFLEVCVEGGAVGLMFLCVFLWLCLSKVCNRHRDGKVLWRFVALAAIMFASAQFSGDIFDSRLFFAAAMFSTMAVQPTAKSTECYVG